VGSPPAVGPCPWGGGGAAGAGARGGRGGAGGGRGGAPPRGGGGHPRPGLRLVGRVFGVLRGDPAGRVLLGERPKSEGPTPGDDLRGQTLAEGDRRVLADSWFKPTARIIAAVSAATLFLYFASHPDFAAPGEWSNKFRLDTALIIFWGPLLYLTMFRQRLSKSIRTYLVLSLFIEAFSETMFFHYGGQREGGYWDTVMWPANVAWFGTIK